MLIRIPEAHSRSLVKAVSWRIVGSLDTFVISWLVTGKLSYAGIILSIETFTKIGIYYAHEQLWSWLPWWRGGKKDEAAPAVTTAESPEPSSAPLIAANAGTPAGS